MSCKMYVTQPLSGTYTKGLCVSFQRKNTQWFEGTILMQLLLKQLIHNSTQHFLGLCQERYLKLSKST